MSLNTFQKNVLFVLLSVSALVGVGLGANTLLATASARREAARVKDLQRRVERVMALNTCAHFTDGEQARLDKVSQDPMGTKKVLLAIHKDRLETWRTRFKSSLESAERYKRADQASTYVSYIQEFNQAVRDSQEALREIGGFGQAVDAIEAHDPMAPLEPEGKKAEKAVDAPKTPAAGGAI